ENQIVDLHSLRHRPVELGHGLLNLVGELDGIDGGLLLHGDEDRGLAHVAGLAALQLGAVAHLRDLMQVDRPPTLAADNDIAKIVELESAADIADEIFAVVLVYEPAAAVRTELLQCLLELLE